uniref:ATP synthase complex subunit 8 n=1 Tax=Aphthona lutescens TaxID=346707 RepID=A0A3G1GNG7_9CUCU|nr:ATP synthase F0 subunit 8 [Aphthona lutescens]
MPQMMPLNWLILMFFFILIFLLFNNLNYFIFYYKTKNNLFPMNFKNHWKW